MLNAMGGRMRAGALMAGAPSGYWTTPIGFWWADGSSEVVDTHQPCG
jgi:hypothetical protein